MTWRNYLLLFLLGLGAMLAVASLESAPGYMDSDYYFAGGLQLAEGKGFTEPYLWNYLDDPAGLPHPSHTYWMPLASLLAAASMILTGQLTFAAARLGFILVASCVPMVTAALAYSLTSRRELAFISGLLAVFPVYSAPFMPTTDNFGLLMLLGGLFFLCMAWRRKVVFFLLGLLAGLMNLARTDSLIWLGVALLFVLWRVLRPAGGKKRGLSKMLFSLAPGVLLVLAGYLLIMGPWFWRNLEVFGKLLAPGGGHALWLTSYNQTFAYPASQVNFQAWLGAGWLAALKARLWALGMNLLNAFAAQGSIFLFPFILLGFWQLRQEFRLRLAAFAWLLLLVVMTLVFPFAGARGAFFHAGAVLQPVGWALAPLGLAVVVDWARRRGWFTPQAFRVFSLAMVVLVASLTALLVTIRVVITPWDEFETRYTQVDRFLVSLGAQPGEVVIARNPPAYYVASGRPAIVLPDESDLTILSLARRYQARYLVLEQGGVLPPQQGLYDHPLDHAGFRYLGELNGTRLYRIETDS
jgi:hypothetical protein